MRKKAENPGGEVLLFYFSKLAGFTRVIKEPPQSGGERIRRVVLRYLNITIFLTVFPPTS